MKKYLIIITLCVFANTSFANTTLKSNDTFLVKPSGQYGVGFADFHWINQNACPDIYYNGKNSEDFSPENTDHCHEIVARIYYPTNAPVQLGDPYYLPVVNGWVVGMQQEDAEDEKENKKDTYPIIDIKQVAALKSYSVQNGAIVPNKIFPTILFSPGSRMYSELYENHITELVSHGYIVVTVNTPFAQSAMLPNGHIVPPCNDCNSIEQNKAQIQLIAQDLAFVYNQMQTTHNNIFAAMDLKRLGIYGHSLGAQGAATLIYAHPTWFQATVLFDFSFRSIGDSNVKAFAIPFLHETSASFPFSPSPLNYELNYNGYIVGLSPNEKDVDYSNHAIYEDLATLQYLPAFEIFKQGDPDFNFGTGNGWELADSINIYMVKFFDTFLKHKVEPAFLTCVALNNNTYMKCGRSNANDNVGSTDSNSHSGLATAGVVAGVGATVIGGMYFINSGY